VLNNGLNLTGVDPSLQLAVKGLSSGLQSLSAASREVSMNATALCARETTNLP